MSLNGNKIFQPFYEYLMQRRRSLLTELEEVEKLLGVSPTTAELRKNEKKNKEPVYVDPE